jgi:hypothetical protein
MTFRLCGYAGQFLAFQFAVEIDVGLIRFVFLIIFGLFGVETK